jgi:nitrogen fixation protein FixH
MAEATRHHPIDRWLPWMIAAVFVLLTAVLFWFVQIAYASFNGTVTDHAYERGLAYNDILAARRTQAESGYAPQLSVTKSGLNVAVSVRVPGAILSAAQLRFIRPTHAGMDQTLPLSCTGNVCTGQATLPVKGVWDAVATLRAGGVPLQIDQRILL